MSNAIEILDSEWHAIDLGRVTLVPRNWEAQATGGPTVATIDGTGDTHALWGATLWLGYHVRIRNNAGTPVWWGLITAATVRTTGAAVTVALDDMRNRINVDYSYIDADGATQDGETGWAEHARSVATYGPWEERVPLADVKLETAETRRDTWLKSAAIPAPLVQWNGGETGVQLECRGYWTLLNNVYYPNALGRVVYDESSNVEHMLGWQLVDDWAIGFARKVSPMRVHDLKARLYDLTVGTKLDISGSVLNNGSFTVTGVPSKPDADHVTYVTNDVFFSSADEMYDNLDGFGVLTAGEMIYAGRYPTGYMTNEGHYFLQGVDPHNIEVWPSTVLDEGTGLTVQFEQGHSVQVEEAVENEFPSAATVTLASRGVRVAQSFQIAGTTAWEASEIMVRVRKIGTPTDPIYVRLSNGATEPVTTLAEGTLAAAEIRNVMEWVTIPFTTPYTLQPATKYWVSVSGGTPGADCYAVGLSDNEDAQYAGGACKVQILAGSWETRWGEAVSMPFQVWGTADTCTQVAAMAAYALPGFATAVRTLSGTLQRYYRDGKQRALSEAQDMINTGDDDGNRIAVQVTAERLVLVGMEPEVDSAESGLCLHYDANTGLLHRADGGLAEAGLLPAGQVVYLDNTETAGGLLAQTRRVFVERAAWDAERGQLSMEPKGMQAPWEI
jgi:hypothetical protein